MSEESQIQHLCNELNIPDNVKNQASLAWQQLKASGACDYQVHITILQNKIHK